MPARPGPHERRPRQYVNPRNIILSRYESENDGARLLKLPEKLALLPSPPAGVGIASPSRVSQPPANVAEERYARRVVVNMKYRSPDSRIVGFVGATATMIIFGVSSPSAPPPPPPPPRARRLIFSLVLPPPRPRDASSDFYAN